MAAIILIVTGLVILVAMLRAFVQTRDPLHPMILIGLLCLYVYSFRPLNLVAHGILQDWLTPDRLDFVVLFRLVSICLFCFGCLWRVSRPLAARWQAGMPTGNPWLNNRIYIAGCFVGTISTCAFLYILYVERGGVFSTFSNPYAFQMASIGYVFESRWMAAPAVIMLAMARRGTRLRIQDLFLAVVFLAPLWLPGLLGAKRGPTFCAMCVLAFSWFTWRGKRPSVAQIAMLLGAAGLVAICLVVYRTEIYIGSKFNLDPHELVEYLVTPEGIYSDEEIIVSGGAVLTAEKFGRYYWGKFWGVMFVVRAIPRQIWPTKYEDCGFGWLEAQDPNERLYGYTLLEWKEAAGYRPGLGASYSFDTSFFLEFSWFGLIFCYLLGMFFAWLWRRERDKGGLARVVFLVSLSLAVYLPTQGVVQYFFYWLVSVVPTAIAWMVLVGRSGRHPSMMGTAPPVYVPGPRRPYG